MATATTLDQFEARTYDALAGVTRVRRELRRAHAQGRFLFLEATTAWSLRRLLAALNHRWLAKVSTDEAKQMCPYLAKLHSLLNQALQLAEEKGLSRKLIHRGFFAQLVIARDRVGDVLESVHLGLNDELRDLVDECSKEVLQRKSRRDWRSSLAALRD